METRIGSTRPMLMKPTMAAKAVAQTDFGWRKKLAFSGMRGPGVDPEKDAAAIRSGRQSRRLSLFLLSV